MSEINLGLWVCLVMIILSLTILLLLHNAGAFKKVIVTTGIPQLRKVYIAYKFYKGEYKNSNQAIRDIAAISSNVRCFGIYYDDPKIIEKGKQRFAISVVLSNDKLEIDHDLEKKFIQSNYKTCWLPEIDNAVLTEFPLLSYAFMLSIIVSVFKVYPTLERFIKKNKLCAHPFIEMYSCNSIDYMVPLSQQSKFYVQEYHEEEAKDEYYLKKRLNTSKREAYSKHD